MRGFIQSIGILFLCFSSTLSLAQKGDTLEIQRTEKKVITFVRFKPNPSRKMHEGAEFLKVALSPKQNHEFRLVKENTDALGMSHRRYQQYYSGVKVEDAEYLLHGKNGLIETINGDFQEGHIPTTTPGLSEGNALKAALVFVNAKKYKWQDKNLESFIKKNANNSNATYYPTGELVITKDYLKSGENLRLAWKFTISSLEPDNEQLVYVDAATGEAIRTNPLYCNVNTPITAQTRYSGTLTLTGDSFAGGFRLRENRNGVNVETLNLQNTAFVTNAIDFTNTTVNFTSAGWSSYSQNQAALDVHYGMETILDYWRTVHARNSFDGNGLRVLSYVNYRSGWSNARWGPGINARYMQYGNGDGITFNPFTSLDMCAHEFAHGINEFTANLTVGTQESGALNEGFSDIWAACVESWAAPNKQTWLIGEEIVSPTFTSLRDLSNPNSTATQNAPSPDTYLGTHWDSNGSTHNNSRVLSHWFFILSEGGSGANDFGNAFAVNGIGINDAQYIAFRAQSVYLNSSANYQAARNATISAAIDLFGANSCQHSAVMDAWHAVGVGEKFVIPASITGSNEICLNQQKTFTINGSTTGTVWGPLPSYVTMVASSASAITLKPTANSNSSFNLTAQVTIGGCVYPITKNIHMNYEDFAFTARVADLSNGNIPINSLNEDIDVEPGMVNVLLFPPSNNTVTHYDWNLIYGDTPYWSPNGTELNVVVPNDEPLFLEIIAYTSCATSTMILNLWPIQNRDGAYSAYPNPAEEEMTVSVIPSETDLAIVALYNNQGRKVHSAKAKKGEGKVPINVRGLPKGEYILHITQNGKSIKRHVIVGK